MTVSRALRGAPGVSDNTRREVLQYAEQIGYKPDPAMSALVDYRNKVRRSPAYSQMAFVTNFDTRDEWKKRDYIRFQHEGARLRAGQLGYNLIEFWLRESGMSAARAGAVLYNRGFLGLIIAPMKSGPGIRKHLRLPWDRFSSVAIGFSLGWPALNMVTSNHLTSVRFLCHKLRHLGFRRIGLAYYYSSGARSLHLVRDAFLGEQSRFPKTGRIPAFMWKHFNEAEYFEWLERNTPDVVITSNPGLPKYPALPKLPIYYLHLNDTEADRKYSGMLEHHRAVGAMAVDQLHLQLISGERGVPRYRRITQVDASWHDGSASS